MRVKKLRAIVMLMLAAALSFAAASLPVTADGTSVTDVPQWVSVSEWQVAANPVEQDVSVTSKADFTGGYTVELKLYNDPKTPAMNSEAFADVYLGNVLIKLAGSSFTAVSTTETKNLPVYAADGETVEDPAAHFLALNAGAWHVNTSFLYKFVVAEDGSKIDVYYDSASAAAPCTQLRNIVKLEGNENFALTNGKFKLAAFVGSAAFYANYGLTVQNISLNGQPADMSLSPENTSFTFSDVSRFSEVKSNSFEVTAAAADLVNQRAGGMAVSDAGAEEGDTLFEISFDVQRAQGGKNAVSSEFGLLFGLKTGSESAVSNGVTGIIFCFDNSFAGVYRGNGTEKTRVGDGAADADNRLVATNGYFENTEAIRDSVIHVTAVGKAGGQLTVTAAYTDVLSTEHNKTVVVEDCDLNGRMAFFYTKTAAAAVDETIRFSGIEYEIAEAEEPSPWQIQPLEFDKPLRVNANPAVNDVYVEGKQPLSGAYSVQVHLLNNPTTSENGMATRNFAEIGLGKVKISIAGGEFTASVAADSGTRSLTVYKADGVTAETENSHFMAIAAGGSGLPVWCVGNEYIFRFEVAAGGGRINVYYDAATASQPCTTLRNVILLEGNGDYSLTNGAFRLSAVSDLPAFYDLLLFGISFGNAAADMQLSSANADIAFSDTAHFCTAEQTSLSVQTGADEAKYQKFVSDFTVSDADAEEGDVVLDVRFTVSRTAESGATNGAFGLLLGMKSEEDTMNTNGVTGILFGSNNVYTGVYRGNGKNMNDNGLQWAVETKLGSTPAGTPGKEMLAYDVADIATFMEGGGYFNQNIITGPVKVHVVGYKGGKLSLTLEYSETGASTAATAHSETVVVEGCDFNGKIAVFYDKVSGVAETVTFGEILVNEDYVYPVTGIELNETALTLQKGESEQLVASRLPAYAGEETLTWSTNNAAVATVDQNGNVTAVAGGNAVIQVSNADGSVYAVCDVTVIEPVTGVSLNKTETFLGVGQTLSLRETIEPANATDKSVKWESSAPAVASVDENGVVTALAVGETTVTVTTLDGGKTAECVIRVVKLVEGISLNYSEYTLDLTSNSKTVELVVTFTPSDAGIRGIVWTSGDESIAKVSQTGIVTAVSAGEVIITATSEDGGKQATCEITVIGGVSGISLNEKEITLKQGETATLVATITPENAINKNVVWTSENETVATVENGVVTALQSGVAVITATTEDGGKVASCTVTVYAPATEPVDEGEKTGCNASVNFVSLAAAVSAAGAVAILCRKKRGR